jgi:hypothetical protein
MTMEEAAKRLNRPPSDLEQIYAQTNEDLGWPVDGQEDSSARYL